MRKRRSLVVTLAAMVLLAVVVIWLRWNKPVPLPRLDLTGAEPDVRTLIESAQDQLAKEPTSAALWGRLGKALLANGYDNEAMLVLERASQLDPLEPRWPYLRARRLLLIDREKGRALLEQAVRLAEKQDPDNVSCKLLLAEALAEQEQHDRVITLAQSVLATDPNNPRAHFYLGTSYLQRDELKKSLFHLQRAAESPFCQKRASVQLAAVSLRLGDQPASEQFTQRARALPNDLLPVDSYVAEYQTLAAGRQAKYLEAERLEAERRLQESARILHELDSSSSDVRSRVALGIALVKLGNNPGAEKILREAVRQGADSAATHYALAVAQFNQAETLQHEDKVEPAAEKYRQCEQSALAALVAKPDHAMAHYFLGRTRFRLGQRDLAIAAFRKAILCRPELAGPHLSLGEALAEANEPAEALRELEQAVALASPEDPARSQANRKIELLKKR